MTDCLEDVFRSDPHCPPSEFALNWLRLEAPLLHSQIASLMGPGGDRARLVFPGLRRLREARHELDHA